MNKSLSKKVFLLGVCMLSIQLISGQNYKFGKVSKSELEAKEHPKYPDAEAAILYRDMHTSINYNKEKGFMVVSEVTERIKIYSQEGFDRGTVEVDLYKTSGGKKEKFSGLKAYTYFLSNGKVEEIKLKSDGIFDQKNGKYRDLKKFTMPSLQEGCVIEYRYKVTSPFLDDINTFRFQETIPVDKVKLRFEAPEYFNYVSHPRGWILFDIEKERYERIVNNVFTQTSNVGGGGTVNNSGNQQFKYFQNISNIYLSEVPPIKLEAYAGNINNYASSLNFELAYYKSPRGAVETFSTDWKSVSDQIYQSDNFGDQLSKRSYFNSDIDNLLKGVTDPGEKMVRIYEFVKKKMNWNGIYGFYTDEGVKKAYDQGTGNAADLNLMLTAMFRHAGFDANPVLVSTKSHGIPLFPTRNGFNFVISAVEAEGGTVLFDATNKMGEPNILNENLLNWQGRLIRDDESSKWVSLAPKKMAVEACMVDAEIVEGEIEGTTKSQFSGIFALEQRDQFEGMEVSNISTEIESRFKEISATEAALENLDNPYKPLKLNYQFECSEYLEEIDDELYITPLLFLTFDESPFKQEERKYPIDYGFTRKKRFMVSIAIPDGYQVQSLPKNINVKAGDNVLYFKYLVSQGNGKIQILSEFGIKTPMVLAEKYPDIKQFYQMMIEKEKEKIVLSKI